MTCQRCKSQSIMDVNGKCSDMYCGDYSKDGYVPRDLGIGGGDYIRFKFCLNCGQIQDKFPKTPPVEDSDEENSD